MNIQDRRDAICRDMPAQGIDLLIGFHDNGHFIEKPNSVMLLAGFKSLGPTAFVMHRDGECGLIVSPAWDAERAAEHVPGAIGSDDLAAALGKLVERYKLPAARIGVVGLGGMTWQAESAIKAALKGEPKTVDAMVLHHTRRKTRDEIARARKAAEIAEKGYERMLQIARPGMREDELATEVRWYMKSLGAEDNFFMMTSGPHSMAVLPSSGRRLQRGDLLLGEITPSYECQMAQICRTACVGPASDLVKTKYALLVHALKQGIAKAQPGNRMAEVCNAINAELEAEGYGEFCHPPHIKRRGHGLGFGSGLPGDVAPDNDIVLEEDMFFVIHPNQYLPETGYMMCGEPTLITATGHEVLTGKMAVLAEIPA